ncbi:class I SAM-dependent methyltransferase [Roseateles sp. UC29_93]|uniref:class I SAM-dependent methyltransferase n=1 Tax=Roseateles sp. UC29_93 TaxID=3350177 RepID=UPI00366DCE9A
MRDPAARLVMEADRVVRALREPLAPTHFLRSDLARRWREQGDLVDFELLDDCTVSARRVPFVSLPPEWCDLQLFQAAELTLRLQREAVEAGFDLKDASAWNVIFDGARPVFCDLLSFEPLTDKRWWAAGQFARHFVLPLLLSRRRGLRACKSFQAWRDGVPHEVARDMLGVARLFGRYWPLMAGASNPPPGVAVAVDGRRSTDTDLAPIRRFREGLHQSLSWMLRGVDPRGGANAATTWTHYTEERAHYSDIDLEAKRTQLTQWLAAQPREWVLDFGCNSGEFSRLAAATGSRVIAVDADHGAVQAGVKQNTAGIHWVVAPMDDLRGGYGWSGTEHPGLPERLRGGADMTLMLALLHHLVIGASIPMQRVAEFAASCTREALVVELIEPTDPQIALMRSQRHRDDPFPSVTVQCQAFLDAGFVQQEQVRLPSGQRVLTLLRRAS